MGIELEDVTNPMTASGYPIDLLIGAEYFESLMTNQRIQIGKNLYAKETRFG